MLWNDQETLLLAFASKQTQTNQAILKFLPSQKCKVDTGDSLFKC